MFSLCFLGNDWYILIFFSIFSELSAFLVLRVGQTGPFLKNFQLRYSGPVKKLRNRFNKKILQKKIKNFFGLPRNLQKTEFTRLRDFLFCNFFVYEPILSFLELKMFKI